MAEAVCKVWKIKGENLVPSMYAIILDYRYNPLIMNFLELPVFYCVVTAKKSIPRLQDFEKKEKRVAANQALKLNVILGGLSLSLFILSR